MLPPGSQIGPITPEQRKALIAGSLVAGVYEKTVDRESAYEKLKGRAAAAPTAAPPGRTMEADARRPAAAGSATWPAACCAARAARTRCSRPSPSRRARSIGSTVGREIIRGVLGSILGGGTTRSRRR